MAKNKEVTRRIPRPTGLTLQMMQLSQLSSEEAEQKLPQIRDMVMYQWFLSHGLICGQSYSQNELAVYLGCSVNDIQVYLRDQVLNSRVWDKGQQEQLLQGLLGQQLSWAMEDRMIVQQQLGILMASQEGKYKPFISDAVLKGLKLMLESSTSMQTLIRSLTGGNTTNFFIQNNNGNQPEDNGVTYEEALEIIESTSAQKALPGSDLDDASKLLEEKYDLNLLPVVNAKEQGGVDLSKEGLTNKENHDVLNSIIQVNTSGEDAEFEIIEEDVNQHVTRRQREYDEEDEDEDPEMDNY